MVTTEPNASRLWDYKPWWCQPWSIVLTGLGLVGGSWLVSHRWWVLMGMGSGVGLWWFYFLVYVPRLFADYSQKRDERSNDGY